MAVTDDPFYNTADHFYVNAQVGEELVTNPSAAAMPEALLLGTGEEFATILVERSNLVADDGRVLSEAHITTLQAALRTIHARFRTLYKVAEAAEFAMEIEFKITAAGTFTVKQARPWVYGVDELDPVVSVALGVGEGTVGRHEFVDDDSHSRQVQGVAAAALAGAGDAAATVESGAISSTPSLDTEGNRDQTPPNLVRASVKGGRLTITFDEDLAPPKGEPWNTSLRFALFIKKSGQHHCQSPERGFRRRQDHDALVPAGDDARYDHYGQTALRAERDRRPRSAMSPATRWRPSMSVPWTTISVEAGRPGGSGRPHRW